LLLSSEIERRLPCPLAVTASAKAGVATTSSQSAFNIITTSRANVRESFAFTAPGAYSSLAGGQSYVANSSATSVAGLVSTEAITSITIQRRVAGADARFATVGGLVVAGVPAPGSVACLAAAGLVGSRRRRR